MSLEGLSSRDVILYEIGFQTKNPLLICQYYREWQRVHGELPAMGEDGSDSEHAQLQRWKLFVEVWKKVAQKTCDAVIGLPTPIYDQEYCGEPSK